MSMTENEAINIIFAQAECETKEHICDKYKCDECELLYMQGTVEEHREALQMAINSLSEIQQYRAIGTIEEFKALKEKNVAKKPRFYAHNYYCTECGNLVGNNEFEWQRFLYCDKCGQKLDWE